MIYKTLPEGYAWSKLTLSQGELQVDEKPDYFIASPQAPYSPANSQLYAFSYRSDQIAYWTNTDPSEFWVTDVAYERPNRVFVDTDGTYIPAGSWPPEHLQEVRWSPDDRHVITYALPGTKSHLIYHLDTGELEEWYWLCRDVVVSPETSELAVLCTADDRLDFSPENTYAIMEWLGDIWYTSERPDAVLSRALPDGTIPWHFSSDGQRVAYFDPDDAGAHLWIRDAKGNVQRLLPGSSLLQRDKRNTAFETYFYELPERHLGFFRWSPDGGRLLAYVIGTPEHPCRLRRSSEDSEPEESPCWQLINLATGEVLWTDLDSADTLFRDCQWQLRIPHFWQNRIPQTRCSFLGQASFSFAASSVKTPALRFSRSR